MFKKSVNSDDAKIKLILIDKYVVLTSVVFCFICNEIIILSLCIPLPYTITCVYMALSSVVLVSCSVTDFICDVVCNKPHTLSNLSVYSTLSAGVISATTGHDVSNSYWADFISMFIDACSQ